MDFVQRLTDAVKKRGNAVCVGIDPRPDMLPPDFLDQFPKTIMGTAVALGEFAREVVDVVANLVPAVKFQPAFFEAQGPEGLRSLAEAMRMAREEGLIVILDGKRNDIGLTAEAYAGGYLGRGPYGPAWEADALTINPWLGSDGVRPFLEACLEQNKGAFVLVRTSNPSAGEFQDLVAEGRPLYRHVAEKIEQWNAPHLGPTGHGPLGAVVGATGPAQLIELRAAMPTTWFLVPGYGAQGGTAADVVGAFDKEGLGAIVNNSRGLSHAYLRPDLKAKHADDWRGAISHAVQEMAKGIGRALSDRNATDMETNLGE